MSKINFMLRAFLLLFFIGFLLTCALVCRAATPAPPDAEALLKRSDVYRNGWPSYVLRVKITNYESGKADEEKLYEVSQKGTEKTYVEFMSPREKGQHLLMLGDDMWVYLPDTSRPVRITPLERLSGDASNGDVARTNYAVDYSPVYLRTEKVGAEDCYVLDLTAKRKGATYQRILYWVAGSGCASGQGRVLSHLGQAYQVRHLRRVRFVRRQSPASPLDSVRRNPP
jgi:outer membrane lipoprotein-sorting protein